jgi:pimeloyl-ACP methyl ester carboxylesterase
MARKPLKDVIVLLPGITGSALAKDGRDVWALSAGAAMRAALTLGHDIQDLALKEDPADVDDLGDGVTAPRVMSDLHLIPGLWKIDGYTKVADAIKAGFEADPGQNFFEFPYDWRRDNRVAARRLARESHDWLKAWRERSGNQEAKLIMIGHSMGGLVARHFIELLDGWKTTRTLITFGTPYRGSLNALGFVANGLTKKLGPFTLMDLSNLLRSFTSVYQLLPVYPCFDEGGGNLLRVTETSDIPNLDPHRAADALAFHGQIREAVDLHQQDDAYVRDRYDIKPVVGTFQPTSQSARLSGDAVEMLSDYMGQDQDGDGTVPLVSATPFEMGNQPDAMYAAERHGSLQNFDPVLVQLSGVLSGLDLDLSTYYGVNSRLSLDLEDAFLADEPVTFRVRPEDESVKLSATVIDADTDAVAARGDLIPADEGWHRAELPPLPAGGYRVTVSGPLTVDPVTDVFGVLPPSP